MSLKLNFDLLTLEVLYEELYDRVKNSLVEKIYQIGNTELFFHIYSPREGKLILSLSVHPQLYRIQLTRKEFSYPLNPPPFVMFLRKHLEGARILDWYIIPQERIVEFIFQRFEGSRKKLIVELMGKYSNIILTSENNIILDAIKHVSSEKSRYREVLPGEVYLYPPKAEKFSLLDIEEENVEKFLNKEKPVKEVLIKDILYINPLLAEEITRDIKEETYASLEIEDREKLKKEIFKIKDKILKRKFQFLVYFVENKPYTFSLFPLEIFENLKKKEFKNLTETIDYIYSYSLESFLTDQLKKKLQDIVKSNLEKVLEKKEEFLQKIKEGESAEVLKIKGDLLLFYQKEIKKGTEKIILPNPYNENKELIEIELDPSLSPVDNAQRYFKKYKKLKKGIEILREQLKKIEEEVYYLNSLELALENTNSFFELQEIEEELINEGYIKKKKEKEKRKKKSEPYKFILEGYEIYVGKNNKQNDYVTFSIAGPEDLWFHARGIPGAHVVLKLKSKEEIPFEIIEKTAELAGYFSKGKNSNYVAIDYTKRKYVQKPKEGKPGFVIYKNEKTIFVKPEKALDIISQLV
ncbi:MAG: NFACT RNA binding domain-containing protein [Dictyoglomaceae bacterium]